MKKILYVLSVAFFVIAITTVPSYAARPTGGSSVKTPLGIDVSWPQCGKTLPGNHAFGIVGVNGGLATTTNNCMKDQLVWASKALGGTQQEKIQLYVNTANPGGLNTESWPQDNIDPAGNAAANPYGSCDGSDSLSCAWQYGWDRALQDVRDRFIPAATEANINTSPSAYIWWLDVETENTWKLSDSAFDHQSNVADLEGMTSYFQLNNIRVGLYSPGTQWNKITGNAVSTSSNLNGLANWRPGGASLTTAKQACEAIPLTSGGQVVLTQFVAKSLDYNYSCIN